MAKPDSRSLFDREASVISLIVITADELTRFFFSPQAAYEAACNFAGSMVRTFPEPPDMVRFELKTAGAKFGFWLPWAQAACLVKELATAAACLDERIFEQAQGDLPKICGRGMYMFSSYNNRSVAVLLREAGSIERVRKSKRIELASGFGACFDTDGRVIALILPPGRIRAHLVGFSPMELIEGALAVGSVPDRQTVQAAFPDVPPSVREAIRLEPSNRRKGRPRRRSSEIECLRFEVLYQVLVEGAGIEEAKSKVASRHHIGTNRRIQQLIGPVRTEIKNAKVFDGS